MDPLMTQHGGTPPRVLEIQGMVGDYGSERHTAQLACGLHQRLGWPVWTLGPFSNSKLLSDMLDAARVPRLDADLKTLAGLWDNVQLVRRLIGELDIQIVHSHLRNADIVAALATWKTGAHWVPTLHGGTRVPMGNPLRQHLLWQLHRGFLTTRASTIIAISGYVKQHNVDDLELPPQAIEVVYNGTDPSRFVQTRPSHEVRQSIGVPADALMILWAGRFRPRKRAPDVIHLAERLASLGRPIHVVMAGDGPEMAESCDAVRARGLQACVHMLGRRTDMADLMNACDALLLTAEKEGFGRVVTEAMACSKPCIVYAGSGPTEIVADGITGFVVEPGDLGQLVQAVMMLADAPQRRQMMGAEGRRRFERLFTLDRFVDHTAAVLEHVLQSSVLANRASA